MTGGTRHGIVTGEAHILEQPFAQGDLGGIFSHVERQRHNGFLGLGQDLCWGSAWRLPRLLLLPPACPDADQTHHDPKTAYPPQQTCSEQMSADMLYHHCFPA